MTVSTEVVARKYFDVAAGVPIAVPFPLYSENEIDVYYGSAALVAERYVDYGVAGQPDECDTFIITPTASLIAKLDALVATDPINEENAITIRSAMGYLTSATPAAVRNTPFTSREFDRTVRRLQEVREAVMRAITLAPTFVGGEDLSLQIGQVLPGRVLIANEAGTAIVAGPNGADISAAQANAAVAKAAADYIESVFDLLNPNNYYTKAQIDTQQGAQNTDINTRALKTTTISAAGLATGGGDIGSNRTITVPKATNADAIAGTDDTKAMTSVRTKEAIAAFAPTPFSGPYTSVALAQSTNRQNTTNKPWLVSMHSAGNGSSGSAFDVRVGTSAVPSSNPIVIRSSTSTSLTTFGCGATFIVNPGESYSYTFITTTPTIYERQ